MIKSIFCFVLLFQFSILYSAEPEEILQEKLKLLIDQEISTEIISEKCNYNSFLPHRYKVVALSFDESGNKYGVLFFDEMNTFVLFEVKIINEKELLTDYKVIKSDFIEKVGVEIKERQDMSNIRMINSVTINEHSKFRADIQELNKINRKGSNNTKTLKCYSILKKYNKDELFDIFFTYNLLFSFRKERSKDFLVYDKEVQFGQMLTLMNFSSNETVNFDLKKNNINTNKKRSSRFIGTIINDLPIVFDTVGISTSDSNIPYEYLAYIYFSYEKRKVDLKPKFNGLELYTKCREIYLANKALLNDDKSYLDSADKKNIVSSEIVKLNLKRYLGEDFMENKGIWDYDSFSFKKSN